MFRLPASLTSNQNLYYQINFLNLRPFSVWSAQSKCHFLFGGLVIFLFQWCALRFSSNFQIRHLLLNLQWLIQSTETFPLSKEIGLNFEKVLFSIPDILVISGRYTLSLFYTTRFIQLSLAYDLPIPPGDPFPNSLKFRASNVDALLPWKWRPKSRNIFKKY